MKTCSPQVNDPTCFFPRLPITFPGFCTVVIRDSSLLKRSQLVGARSRYDKYNGRCGMVQYWSNIRALLLYLGSGFRRCGSDGTVYFNVNSDHQEDEHLLRNVAVYVLRTLLHINWNYVYITNIHLPTDF